MLETRFGIEVEFTGITRTQAAKVAAEFLGGRIESGNDYYNTQKVIAPDGRVWKFMSDGSIRTQKKERGRIVEAGREYSVELVSPILTYREDIKILQELIRRLRKAGAFAVPSCCGIHVHIDSANHTPRSIRNFINIIASKNDLLYKALQIEPERMRFCKKMDAALVEKINRRKPKTMATIESIWYEGYSEMCIRDRHPEDLLIKLEASIREFGFTNPVLISSDNMILAGHARCKAAARMGIQEVPAVRLALEGAKADAYVIVDNKLNELAQWDTELLMDLIKDIDNSGFDVSLTGFDAAEIDELFRDKTAANVKEDNFDAEKAAAEIKTPVTQRDDLWMLGSHRLMCGDSALLSDVQKLMDGQKARCV